MRWTGQHACPPVDLSSRAPARSRPGSGLQSYTFCNLHRLNKLESLLKTASSKYCRRERERNCRRERERNCGENGRETAERTGEKWPVFTKRPFLKNPVRMRVKTEFSLGQIGKSISEETLDGLYRRLRRLGSQLYSSTVDHLRSFSWR